MSTLMEEKEKKDQKKQQEECGNRKELRASDKEIAEGVEKAIKDFWPALEKLGKAD